MSTFFQSTLFPIDVFYFRRFVPVDYVKFYVFSSQPWLFDVMSQSTFFILDPFVPVGVFPIRRFVPFRVFSFDVLSVNIFYRRRYLLWRFVSESWKVCNVCYSRVLRAVRGTRHWSLVFQKYLVILNFIWWKHRWWAARESFRISIAIGNCN